MEDYLVRILTKSGAVRALACVTTGMTAEAVRRHGTLPTASNALGRAVTGGALMGALLKAGQRVSLKFEGNGPLGKILVEAQSNGAVAGTVGNPDVDLPLNNGKVDVAGALGRAGFLTVTKDLGMKQPYQGTVQLVSSEIGDDLALYLTESEQIPSAVGLGVFVEPDGSIGGSGGFLLQALPPQDDATIDILMQRIGELPPLSEHFRTGGTPEQLLNLLFEGIPYDVIEKRVVAFHCTCSREKGEQALLTQGIEALREIAERDNGITVTCSFCKEVWNFTPEEIETLFAPESPVAENGETASDK